MLFGVGSHQIKYLGLAGVLMLVGSITLSFLIAYGFLPLPIDPALIIGIGIMAWTFLTCCIAVSYIGALSSRIPEYGDMEISFKEGKAHYDDGEWQEALVIFKDLMGPEMNHLRALYYGARCTEELQDFEAVKVYCKYYLKMKRKDKEVWEMLARAHKKFFEYEEAEDALEVARKL